MSEEIFLIEQVGDTLVVTPQGDLFQYRYESLRNGYNEIYRRLTAEDVRHLAIDFLSTGHFGSAFVGMLIKLAKKVRHDGGEAVLCGLTNPMKEILDQLMLLENVQSDFFWTPYPDRSTALAALEQHKS